ncbi:hypothetical protein CH289_16120 [Rhodococcus sp. RS1C4]|nr:hypothetical protein [Rhodococcus sp. RS1C4]OZC50551.1 hypothetical protein CH289_16120 [Rhodococcus sp. RS1C4]
MSKSATANKAAEEICRKIGEQLAVIPLPETFGPWRVVSPEKWETAAGEGWATGYVEIITPNGGEFDPSAVLHFAAEPQASQS